MVDESTLTDHGCSCAPTLPLCRHNVSVREAAATWQVVNQALKWERMIGSRYANSL